MKVWGGIVILHGHPELDPAGSHGQYRMIIATRSWAAVVRALESLNLGRPSKNYWSTTGNEQELTTALAAPGIVFARPLDQHCGEYKQVQVRQR